MILVERPLCHISVTAIERGLLPHRALDSHSPNKAGCGPGPAAGSRYSVFCLAVIPE